MSAHDSVAGLEPRQIWDGVVARTLHGAGITVGILEFEPMTQVAESRQRAIGTRPQGVDHNGHRRRTSRLQVGGMYSIGSGVPDSGEAGPDGATVLDVFSPVRSDWNDTPRMAVAEARWP